MKKSVAGYHLSIFFFIAVILSIIGRCTKELIIIGRAEDGNGEDLHGAGAIRFDKEVVGNRLGLSIAKGILVQQGGTIYLESEKGKGSTFYFSVPAAFSSTNNH